MKSYSGRLRRPKTRAGEKAQGGGKRHGYPLIGVDFLVHAKNPGMEGHPKGDTALFRSSDLQHNSGQNIPTFAPHTPETHSTA